MSIYQELYELINTYIYGGQIVSGSYQELVAILMATIGVVLLVAMPFVIVKKIIDSMWGF
jgi:hypothetical protein